MATGALPIPAIAEETLRLAERAAPDVVDRLGGDAQALELSAHDHGEVDVRLGQVPTHHVPPVRGRCDLAGHILAHLERVLANVGTDGGDEARSRGSVLREHGVIFAGIDVIGDYMTEVNVTSPTGIRELDTQFDLNIAGLLFDAIESELA